MTLYIVRIKRGKEVLHAFEAMAQNEWAVINQHCCLVEPGSYIVAEAVR